MDTYFYDNIEGWFNWHGLYDEIVGELPDGSNVIEIGSWMGKSIVYLADQVKKSDKNIKITAIDIWDPSYNHPVFLPMIELAKNSNTDLHGLFLFNLQKCGVSDLIASLKMNSLMASKNFKKESLDMAFLDANHSYDAVIEDLTAWWPKIKPYGIFAGHDYLNPPPDGVKQAVDEFFKSKNIFVQIKDGCWYVRKPI